MPEWLAGLRGKQRANVNASPAAGMTSLTNASVLKESSQPPTSSNAGLEVPPDTLGVHVLYEPRSDIPIILDIIAIHGLGGDSYTTWTHPNKTLWLRDLLPHDLRNSRIITYGYDAGIFTKATTQRTFDFAENLLSAVKDWRVGEVRHRPLIFLAHSLGGIVLKKALIMAHLGSSKWADLLQSVRHIIFFGTPHHGVVSVAEFLRGLSSSVLRAKSDSVLRELELWSGPSVEVNAHFVGDVTKNFTWTSAVESEGILGTRIVLKGSGVLNQPEETIITLNADHHGMCKFSGAQDNNYRTISQRIQAEVSDFSNHEIIRAHEERVQALLRSARKLIEEGSSWLSSSNRTFETLSNARECFDRALSNARESDNPNMLLRTYRGLLYVELEMTHLPGLENKTHINLAEAYCEKANEAARKSSGLGNLSKVQFDRACITERKASLVKKESKASVPSLRNMWTQAFGKFNRIAIELGKIEDLPVDMMILRIRALHEAGRMAVELQGISLHSQSILPIPEDKSTRYHSLIGENLLSVSCPFSFYREALAVIERFCQEADLSQLDPTDLQYLTRTQKEIRLRFEGEST